MESLKEWLEKGKALADHLEAKAKARNVSVCVCVCVCETCESGCVCRNKGKYITTFLIFLIFSPQRKGSERGLKASRLPGGSGTGMGTSYRNT